MSTSVSRRSSATGHPTRQQLDELDALLKRMLDLPVNRLEDEADAAAPAPAAGTAPQPPLSAPEPMRGPHRPPAARPPVEPPAVNYSTAEAEEADLKPRVVADAAQSPAPAAEPPNGQRSEDWVPLTSTWRPSARTWKPLSEAWTQAQTASGQPAEPLVVEEEPALASEPTMLPPTAPEPPIEAASPTPEPNPAEAAALTEAPNSAPALASPTGAPRLLLWPLLGFNAVFDACLTPWGAPGRWLRGRTGRMALGVVGLLALAAAAALAAAGWFGWTG